MHVPYMQGAHTLHARKRSLRTRAHRLVHAHVLEARKPSSHWAGAQSFANPPSPPRPARASRIAHARRLLLQPAADVVQEVLQRVPDSDLPQGVSAEEVAAHREYPAPSWHPRPPPPHTHCPQHMCPWRGAVDLGRLPPHSLLLRLHHPRARHTPHLCVPTCMHRRPSLPEPAAAHTAAAARATGGGTAPASQPHGISDGGNYSYEQERRPLRPMRLKPHPPAR